MGKHRQAARVADRTDRLQGPEPVTRDVSGRATPDQSAEGVLDAGGEPCRDEGAAHGRSAERIVGADGERLELRVDRHAQFCQPADRARETLGAATALRRERCLEGRVFRVHPEAQDVELALPQPDLLADDRIDLDAGDELQARRYCGRRHDLSIAGQGVVIGQGEGGNATVGCGAKQLGRLQDAVGSAGVGMQVNPRWSGRHDRIGERARIVSPAPRPCRWRVGHVRLRRAAGSVRWRAPVQSRGRCRSGWR